MSEQIKITQEYSAELAAKKKQLFEDIEADLFEVAELDGIPHELHKDIALKLIAVGNGALVVENLSRFAELNQPIALTLVNAGFGLEVMNNMDYFDGLDDNIVAEAMLLCGQGGFVRLNQELFPSLTEETLAKINDRSYQSTLADRERIFGKKVTSVPESKNKKTVEVLTLIGANGQEARLEMPKLLNYWTEFYKKQGIDWIKMPQKLTLTQEDIEELTKGAKALCPEGHFERLIMMIIPAGLADSGEKYVKLHEKMSEGYKKTYQTDNFKADGGFEGLKNKSDKLRIILVKDVQNLEDDELYKSTLNKSADDLESVGGIFEQTGLRGIDTSVYLVWQRDYFKRTGNHVGALAWTLLTEQRRPPSGRVADSVWDPHDGQLLINSCDPGDHNGRLGCRLSCTLEK